MKGNTETNTMKLESAKKRYTDEWLAFKYTNEANDEGEVLAHEKNRSHLYKKLDLKKAGGKVYITFTGRLLPRDCSILFSELL